MPSFEAMKKQYYPTVIGEQLKEMSNMVMNETFSNSTSYRKGIIYDCNMEEIQEIELTTNLMKRCIGVMPLAELQGMLKKFSRHQIQELAEYAIMDRWGKTKEMFSQFAEMTSTLFQYRREKTEGEAVMGVVLVVSLIPAMILFGLADKYL